MVTSSTLRDYDYTCLGYWLVVDGFPCSWVSDNLTNLEGTSWATSSGSVSYAPVTASLRNDFILNNKLDLREGQLIDTSVEFRLWDKTGELAPLLFRSVDPDSESVQGIILPSDDASQLTKEGNSTSNKNVGHERFDAQERHLYPTWQNGGDQYRIGNEILGPFPELGITAEQVSDYPIIQIGRRVTLYEIVRDHVTFPANNLGGIGQATWRDPTEARPIWFGKISGIGDNLSSADEISISCYGASSYLKGELASEVVDNPVKFKLPTTRAITSQDKKFGFALQHIIFDPHFPFGASEIPSIGAVADTITNGQSVTFYWDWSHDQELNIPDEPTKSDVISAISDVISTWVTASMTSVAVYRNHESQQAGLFWGENFGEYDNNRPGASLSINDQGEFIIQGRRLYDDWENQDFGSFSDMTAVMPQALFSLSPKIWALLGYEPYQQNAFYFQDDEKKEEYGLTTKQSDEINFPIINGFSDFQSDTNPIIEGQAPDGHVTLFVHTCKNGMEEPGGWGHNTFNPAIGVVNAINQGDPDAICRYGNPRTFKPLYPNGYGYLLPDISLAYSQEIHLLNSKGSRGQKNRPPLSAPGDTTTPYSFSQGLPLPVNRRGNLLIYGKNKNFIFNDEPTDEFQVYEASWRNPNDDQFRISGDGVGQVVLHGLRDPDAFGLPNPKLFVPWPIFEYEDEEPVYATHVNILHDHLTTNLNTPPRLDLLIQRILVTSGDDPSWTDYQGIGLPAATFTAGINDNGADAATDCDYASYGLDIPASMIASASEWKDLIQSLPEKLQKGRIYWRGPLDLEPLWKGICQSRGLAWSLHNKKFSMFDYTQQVDPADDDVTIITQQMMADPDRLHVPFQQFRINAPIDEIKLDYNWNIVEDNFDKSFTYKSRKRQSKKFANRQVSIADRTLCNDMGFGGDFKYQMHRVTSFWAKTHNVVTINLHRNYGLNLDVGSKVAITDTRIRSSLGVRGITLTTGRVIDWKFDAARQLCTIKVIVYAEGEIAKRYAPFARVRGYDSGNARLYLYDDFLEIGNRVDAGYFREPAFTSGSFGGQAEIKLMQRIGRSRDYRSVGSANVVSANITPGDSYLTIASGSITNYLRDQDTWCFLADHGTQDAAWVREMIGVTTNSSGTFGGAKMRKWLD